MVENTRQAYQAGFAFGSFQDLISDMNPDDIVETIRIPPRNRFNRLMEVAARIRRNAFPPAFRNWTSSRRASRAWTVCWTSGRRRASTRITHNDTKINNVMLDEDTDHAVCVIDLDTVMPGLVLYDFGDMVRTVTPPTEEKMKKTWTRCACACRCSNPLWKGIWPPPTAS